MSKRTMPWLQFFPADWLSDSVAGCSLAAQGLWLRMLFVAHNSQHYGYLEVDGHPIPDEQLFRRCGCSSVEEYRNLFAELQAAGVPSRTADGVIFSRRMARDQEQRDATAQRVRKHRERLTCNASVTPMSREEVRSQKSEIRSQSKSNTRESDSLPIADGFEKFWTAYPKKVDKPASARAWRKVMKPEEADAILARIELNKIGEWAGKEKRYIPNPATWLNGRRWTDEILGASTDGKRNAKPPVGDNIRTTLEGFRQLESAARKPN